MDGILNSSASDDAQASEIASRNAVSANPRDHRAQQALCESLVRQNRLDEAATALRKAIVWLPDVPSLRIQLAFVQARQGQHAAARQTLAQAAEHLPPGSRMHTEIVETAGAALAVPAPHEATSPMGHLKPLVIQPTVSAAPPQGKDVALGLDDLASIGIADLVRAGQAARIEQAESEYAEADPPSMPPVSGSVGRSRRAPLLWAVAVLTVIVGVATWQAASLIAARLQRGTGETSFVPARGHTHDTPPPAPVAKAPKAIAAQAARPPQPEPQAPRPVDFSALPDLAQPIVTLGIIAGDDVGKRQQANIIGRIRALGLTVSDQIVTVPASSRPGVTYWFAEDKEAALSVSKALGDAAASVEQGHLRQGEALPVPGSMTVILPVAASPNSK